MAPQKIGRLTGKKGSDNKIGGHLVTWFKRKSNKRLCADPKWGETPDGGEDLREGPLTWWDEDYPERWFGRCEADENQLEL